jgi:hypothetical protein
VFDFSLTDANGHVPSMAAVQKAFTEVRSLSVSTRFARRAHAQSRLTEHVPSMAAVQKAFTEVRSLSAFTEFVHRGRSQRAFTEYVHRGRS